MPAPTDARVTVRPFRRDDRQQLTDLVNLHVAAVVPGAVVSVHTLLSQLEREPGEYVVDPWVGDRATLVAVQRERIVAAAHLLRYADRPEVGPSYRGIGELRWFVCLPEALDAGAELIAAAARYLADCRETHADGALPAPGVYGVPEQWPHVAGLLTRAGFVAGPRTETVHLADLTTLPRPPAPYDDLAVVRSVGGQGTVLAGVRRGRRLAYVEVSGLSGDGGRVVQGGWADVANLWVEPDVRRRGIATWLLGRAADWLRLGHVDRLLDYSGPDEPGYAAFLAAAGFVELTTTRREWLLTRR